MGCVSGLKNTIILELGLLNGELLLQLEMAFHLMRVFKPMLMHLHDMQPFVRNLQLFQLFL